MVSGRQDAGDHAAATCAMRAPARTNSASGKPTSACRRMAASASAATPKPTSATSWRWCWTTRLSASRRFSRRSKTPAASPAWAAKKKPSTCRATCAPARCRRASVYMEERSIGPSLGADSIHQGIIAGIAGLLAVIVVMLVYYKRAGVNAVLALVLNTVILLAARLLFPRGADAARHRRHHPDHRYGGGFQRADFRAHPRRVAQRARA